LGVVEMLKAGPRAWFLGSLAVCLLVFSPQIIKYVGAASWWFTFLAFVSVVIAQQVFGHSAKEAAKKYRVEATKREEKSFGEGTEGSGSRARVLYLRPFSEQGKQQTSNPYVPGLSPSSWTDYGWLEFEGLLARACSGNLVVLGGDDDLVGPVRIKTDDLGWKTRFSEEARRASAIVVLPSAARGTAWEIEWLMRSRLLEKTIFFMPPRVPAEDKAKWDGAVTTLKNSGIQLPAYDPRGCYFQLNCNGTVDNIYQLKNFSVHVLRDIIFEVVSRSDKRQVWRPSRPAVILISGVILGALFWSIPFVFSGPLALLFLMASANLTVRVRFTVFQAVGVIVLWIAAAMAIAPISDKMHLPHLDELLLAVTFGAMLTAVAYRTRARITTDQAYRVAIVWFVGCLAGMVTYDLTPNSTLLATVWGASAFAGSYCWFDALTPPR
jgi:hypothetical protein